MIFSFGVLALLPLALASLFRKNARQSDAGFLPLLAALAPVVAKGIGSIIKHKQQSAAEKKQAQYEQQQAAAAEQADRAKFEAAQNSPALAMQRMGFNMKLGRLLGAMGGRDKVPPSLLKSLDQARAVQSYVPGASYVPKPGSGNGLLDVAEGAMDALSYLDTSKLGSNPQRSFVEGATTPDLASKISLGSPKTTLTPLDAYDPTKKMGLQFPDPNQNYS
jgi:hypothetical protein